ncbi:hypothetical protein ABW02_22200 [Niallia circulans]|jgi:hypothetical protein|uniref:Uncharacterized protein n=1 Tax=Niallia circulans TaxID=1397 RepID=A0A0J1I7Z8_NIACI|nr:hypothetical protein [Niallia circulans]KLV22069.1 hypothetical protein ABW02_22200 [Niallia circulans]MED5099768.1 hypothetical protein [Niallia circulans]
MNREIIFEEDAAVLKIRGFMMLFTFKHKVKMPYNMIKSVFVDYFDPPKWMIRMPGTSISPLNIYEGSYKYQDEWYFLSYEGRIPVVIIELDNHEKYRYVIFQIENPTEVAAELRRKMAEAEGRYY